ncbi:MAG: preprotein translocase subunit SecY [Atopobiaceae bacterium]|nr:preprotein translocase subunit SecY [Atopobiaceae bacterium]MCH4180352.1 preprotein translocase subunit SecY [Atopobiaceae bacterium]MCH4214556.1 preprotein translocase subunit SecY [Atopobiaceae bacterium]MCH4229275.1 preprotein translocase subunit SecY [Atopobiaceae bacterium]MCH4276330.1 preprotein translocase subunit SecY [Atopobiaceae bacterium]
MLNGILNAFRVPELRRKLLITIGILVLYRVGAYLPVPGIPFSDMLTQYQNSADTTGAVAVLNLFSGGALSRMSVFSLGIMPYITAQIIMQMMQSVVPSLGDMAKEGESGQRKITQYTRYLTVGLALLNAIGYLFLFKSDSYGISWDSTGVPGVLMDIMVVVTMLAGAILIMWLGEVITQRGVGNGMSLIIFANIMSGLPTSIIQSFQNSDNGGIMTILIVVVILAIIPLIVFIERGQRRIPVQYAKRVVGRRVMGGQATYLPIKVNTAGVIPIIFASALLYFPAQIAVFFPSIDWMQTFANAVSSGWVNWILSVVLIVFFAYFYTSMVFNPEETADTLRKQGGFIPGVRPGAATAAYIKSTLSHITLPGALFMAVIAVVPSIIFTFTSNSLIQAFGGTSILIMVGVALDTISQLESQLKTHDYEGIFK